MIYLLTQNDCPQCESIKQFLKHGLAGKYDGAIEIVNRQEDEDRFMSMVSEHSVRTTPCLIAGEDLLRQPTIGNIEEFIKSHL